MTAYIIRRLIFMIPVMWGVGTFVFVLVRLLPGDAVTVLLEDSQSAQGADQLRAELGLDKPLAEQYVDWLGKAVTFNFGDSLLSGRPVASELWRAMPITLELAVLAVVITLIVAIPGGILAAAKQDSIIDYGARMFAVIFQSIPNFWLATMALLFSALWFSWIPPVQYRSLIDDPWWNVQQFLLPAIILGVGSAAVSLRMMRSQMLEVLRQDYIRTARAKGLIERSVIVRHGARNALLPVVTLVGNEFGRLLGGAVITEVVFGLPGVGRLTLDAIFKRDYPQIETNVLFFAVAFVLVNLLIDILYLFLDPRVKYA